MDLVNIAQDFAKTFLSDFEVIEQKKTERGDVSLKISNSNGEVWVETDPNAVEIFNREDLLSLISRIQSIRIEEGKNKKVLVIK